MIGTVEQKETCVQRSLTIEEIREGLIEQVIDKLGMPDTKYFVDPKNVFDNRWRVNVWVDQNPQSHIPRMQITHSYFLKVDEYGAILNEEIIENVYG